MGGSTHFLGAPVLAKDVHDAVGVKGAARPAGMDGHDNRARRARGREVSQILIVRPLCSPGPTSIVPC